MVDSILKSTRGKSCTSLPGKICTECNPKKNIHLKITIKDPKQLTKSGNINQHPKNIYNQNAITVQHFEKLQPWRIRKRQKQESQPPTTTTISRWYKRRKVLRQLNNEQNKEKQILNKKEENERVRLKKIIDGHQNERKKSSSLPVKKFKTEKTITEKVQILTPPPKKFIHIKEKSAIVKPHARSKHVSVKQHMLRDSITKRFVNYCYRFCCQLYCYLTCIVIITFIIIFIV